MRISILVIYTEDWQSLADITLRNIEKYCGRHHYGYFFNRQKDYNGFDKIRAIQAIFKRNDADCVWCLDLDTLITNHKTRIEDFIDNEHDAYFTFDYNGLNCGSFIIKKTFFSEMLLDTALMTEGFPRIYCEQDAFNEVFKLSNHDIFDKIKSWPHPSINSYLYELYPDIPKQTHEQGQWEVGDFVLHLPGYSTEKRIEILNKIKDQIVYE